MLLMSRKTRGPRLPGVRFEAQPPPLAEVLPRMDVAVFVGFAASGPVNTPVAVVDAAQFALIFGGDAALVSDAERGDAVRAYLAPAVRSFFRNGGRRCWVVRVARDAKSNSFPVPALIARRRDGTLAPAFAQARSEGSWSDAVRVGTSLKTRPLEVTSRVEVAEGLAGGLTFEVEPSSPGDVRAGDLLRLSYRDEGYTLLAVVREASTVERNAQSPPASPPDARRARRSTIRVTCGDALWCRAGWPGGSPLPVPDSVSAFKSPSEAVALPSTGQPTVERGIVSLDLRLALTDAPPPGSVLRVDFGAERLWLTVRDASARGGGGDDDGIVRVRGEGFWSLAAAPPAPLTSLPAGERLTFDLLARQNGDEPLRLGELGFAPGHARYWGAWPTDVERFRSTDEYPAHERHEASTASEFFPLAGLTEGGGGTDKKGATEVYFPVAMPFIGGEYLGAVASDDDALTRDGLSDFDEYLFLDDKLVGANTESLIGEADFIRYQSTTPRRLRGIHAALGIEEATIIAVPDAVHRGWKRREPDPTVAQPSGKIYHPEWWRFRDCNAPAESSVKNDADENGADDDEATVEEIEPKWGDFIDCCVREVPTPQFEIDSSPMAAGPTPGTVSLSWTPVADAEYVVEESPVADWSGAAVVYRGPKTRVTFYGRGGGVYFYRVRAEICGSTSEWSDGFVARLDQTEGWGVLAEKDYNSRALIAVQRALLRMCAARGDLFAVLALPEHYREDDAITHAETLKPFDKAQAAGQAAAATGGSRVQPLSKGEEYALSYGALYHPWLVGARADARNNWERIPPDGAACGVLAERALSRGAWVAPANELLQGVVALTPPMASARRLDLQEGRVNLVRQEPRGFVVLCADTLSAEEDLRPINVRRLLMLLRRLALRLGSRYVFEPNDDTFRRGVQRGFEAMLDHMHRRGAFAGRTRATSFQVVTDTSLNTPQSVEQGRFIVELKVAPSLPLTFLTVRLVQTGDRATVTEVR